MSKKIRGIDEAELNTPSAKHWAEVASNPAHDGVLIVMLSGDSYHLLGNDAVAASEALDLPLNSLSNLVMFSFSREKITSHATQLRNKGLRIILCSYQGNVDTAKSFWRARVEVIMGDRRMSDVMSKAGLGITSVGTKEVLTLNYTPGENVDAERVKAGMENLISIADRDKSEFIISSYKLLTLELITP